MDVETYRRFQQRLSAIRTPDDVERVAEELRALAAASPADPDVPELGEQLAMIRGILRWHPTRGA